MWLVCKYKDGSGYFIVNRIARETMLSVMIDLGQEPNSIVLKRFDDYSEAHKYMKEMERIDKQIGNL